MHGKQVHKVFTNLVLYCLAVSSAYSVVLSQLGVEVAYDELGAID